MAFWIAGVPGSTDIVKVEVRCRHQPAWDGGDSEQRLSHWRKDEEEYEQTHAAVGDGGARENHGEHGPA
jgi:hypothetical protein